MKNILFAILMIAALTVFTESTNASCVSQQNSASYNLPDPSELGYVLEFINGQWYWVLYDGRGYIVDVIEVDD